MFALALFAALVAAFLLPGQALADNYSVQCGVADPETLPPGTFPTITAALTALPINSPFEPHTITVTGTCVENVAIIARQNITIQAPAGETATIVSASTDPNTAPPTLRIERSRSIQINRLALQGGRTGLRIWASYVTARDVSVENSSWRGVDIGDNSTVYFNGALTIQNSATGSGLTVASLSKVTLGADDPGIPTLIASNGSRGVNISESSVTINGNTTIKSNAGVGVYVENGKISLRASNTRNAIRGNASYGIALVSASSADLTGQNLIQNNVGAGIYVAESRLGINSSSASDGSTRVTLIEGHTENGIALTRQSAAVLTGPHMIRNNGSPAGRQGYQAGILLNRNSTLMAANIEVSGSLGPGLWAEQLCNLRLENMTITGNSAEGVLVLYHSVAHFVTLGTISSNGGASIACDSSSMALQGQPVTGIIKCSTAPEPKKQ